MARHASTSREVAPAVLSSVATDGGLELDADPAQIHAQVPGAMGIGTQHPRPVPPAGWKRPKKPDPMTRGRKP